MKRIFLIGYMGCGIAKKYGLEFIDLDHYIENRFFKTIPQIFEERGEEGFRQIEHNMLLEVSAFEDAVISTGGGAACFFDNIDVMNQAGETVYLKATPKELFEYLKTSKQNRPLLQGKNDEELLQFIEEGLGKREPFYLKAKHTMDYMDTSDTLFDQLLK